MIYLHHYTQKRFIHLNEVKIQFAFNKCDFPAGAGNFSLHHRFQKGSGAHTASYPIGTRDSFPGVKRPGREADHSPQSSAEAKE
jgi:hypothetical protein